jgi:hypothetical protein
VGHRQNAAVDRALRPRVARPRARRALLVAGVWALGGCARWRAAWRDEPREPPPALGGAAPDTPLDAGELQRLYVQGANALAADDLDGSVVAWRRYVRGAGADDTLALRLRGYVTLLERESARRFARQAVQRERSLGAERRVDRRRIAIFPLSVSTGASGEPLGRALLAMITTDLARVPSLTLLERERLDALLAEQRLSAAGLVDPATLVPSARLLGAGSVVAGSVISEAGPGGPGSGRYKINTALSDVASARVTATQEADGLQADFFRLQKQIVHGLLQALGVRDIPSAVDHVHTRSWEAYRRFGDGLQRLSEGRYDDARRAFRAALAADAGFALAESAWLDTPAREATPEQIRLELARSVRP